MKTNLPSLREMVGALISTPSVSSTQSRFDQSNGGVIDLIANWLDPLGFEVHHMPIPGKPGKSNLIARRGSGVNGLLLSGHSDTVPFNEHLWESDPFRLREKDDKWFGLGACDMKSFFAIALDALRPLVNEPFSAPLIIMATADEESSMSGAKQLMREHLAGVSRAVIGEPTGLLPVTRHKGIMMLRLRVEGTSGHSSNPALGNNAIEGMHLAISELLRFRQELKDTFFDPHFEVSFPTMNFGCIHGGDNPNRICDHAELEFDLRAVPSMDMTDFVTGLEHRIAKRLEHQGFTVSLSLLHSPLPAFENASSELARDIVRDAGQSEASVAFGTEAPYLLALELDTVVIGPGSINQAHQPNEYLSLSEIEPATRLIRHLIAGQCLTA